MTRATRLAALFAIITMTGCGATKLPPPLTPAESSRIASVHLPLSVGVETFESPAYSDALLDTLRETGLFDRVDPLDAFAGSPDLVASVAERVYGKAVVPVATAATLGVVPTSVDETVGRVFTLRGTSDDGDSILIDYRYERTTTLGWAGGMRGMSSEWMMGDSQHSNRFVQRVALAIADQADAIGRLAE